MVLMVTSRSAAEVRFARDGEREGFLSGSCPDLSNILRALFLRPGSTVYRCLRTFTTTYLYPPEGKR